MKTPNKLLAVSLMYPKESSLGSKVANFTDQLSSLNAKQSQ
jgi:hypothetical protein